MKLKNFDRLLLTFIFVMLIVAIIAEIGVSQAVDMVWTLLSALLLVILIVYLIKNPEFLLKSYRDIPRDFGSGQGRAEISLATEYSS